MKKTFFTTLITVIFFTSIHSQNNKFNTADLQRVAKIVGFRYTKNFKNLPEDKLIQIYSSIESDRSLINQININSWGICEHYNIDNFDTYNYYYKPISRTVYNRYCRELNALMLLDGTIKQIK